MDYQRMNSRAPAMKELQGPRPPPLKISRESHKIRKAAPRVPSVPSNPIINRTQPVIIYMHSPKVIHAEVKDFMTLVQRLTGRSSSSDTRSSCGTKSENLTADHDPTTIRESSDVTTSSQPDESVDQSMGSPQEIESRASVPEATDRPQPAKTASPGNSSSSFLIAPLSPFSPNFLFPSQSLLSPSIFQDIPLFTPNSDHFFYSPRHFYRFSEPMFSPPQRQPLNTSTMELQSPSPTTIDLFKTLPES